MPSPPPAANRRQDRETDPPSVQVLRFDRPPSWLSSPGRNSLTRNAKKTFPSPCGRGSKGRGRARQRAENPRPPATISKAMDRGARPRTFSVHASAVLARVDQQPHLCIWPPCAASLRLRVIASTSSRGRGVCHRVVSSISAQRTGSCTTNAPPGVFSAIRTGRRHQNCRAEIYQRQVDTPHVP